MGENAGSQQVAMDRHDALWAFRVVARLVLGKLRVVIEKGQSTCVPGRAGAALGLAARPLAHSWQLDAGPL